MAVLIIAENDKLTRDGYEGMLTALGETMQNAPGFVAHMGWFTPEMELFGRQQLPHDQRYAYGQEWVDFVEKLWTEHGDFDVEGEHFTSTGGWTSWASRARPSARRSSSSRSGRTPS